MQIKSSKEGENVKIIYEIMHGEEKTARVDTQGHCEIYDPVMMPYNLYLDDTEEEIDTLVNNVTNFYFWCASRMLTLDRKYAKEILNSIGAAQAMTDRERAQIALIYRCVSLTDIYWVKKAEEQVKFADVNLYQNHLDNAFVDVALRGRQISVENKSLARDLSTNGCFPKAWVRKNDRFLLMKDGGADAVEREVLASKVCQCFSCPQVIYKEGSYDGEKVSVSELMTSPQYSIVSREAFEIYAANREIDALEFILQLDAYSFYMMNILDYLVGNTDRHWGNWGLLVDNRTNQAVSLHALMDFNQSFQSYHTLEGANCQTVYPRKQNQKEAAVEAVAKIGLNQIAEIREEWFQGRENEYRMLRKRLESLKAAEKAQCEWQRNNGQL